MVTCYVAFAVTITRVVVAVGFVVLEAIGRSRQLIAIVVAVVAGAI